MVFLICTALQFILFVPFFIIWIIPFFCVDKNKYYDILGLRGGAQDQPRKGVRALGRRVNPSRTIL